jgi:hypothetical protein
MIAHCGQVHGTGRHGTEHVHEEVPHRHVSRGVGDVSAVVDRVHQALRYEGAYTLSGVDGWTAILIPRVRHIVGSLHNDIIVSD